MFWWIIGVLNIVLAVIELTVAFKSKDNYLSWVHVLYSLMFISYGASAINGNLLFGIPGLVIGLFAVFLNFRYRNRLLSQ